MKKAFLLIMISLFFYGCTGPISYDTYYDKAYIDRYTGKELYEIETEYIFSSLEEIGGFLGNNITWEAGGSSPVKQPIKTWEDKTGNCEDISILFINIAYLSMGIECDLVLVDKSEMSREVISGGDGDHAMIAYNGIIYEPQSGYIYTGPVKYRYPCKQIFNI